MRHQNNSSSIWPLKQRLNLLALKLNEARVPKCTGHLDNLKRCCLIGKGRMIYGNNKRIYHKESNSLRTRCKLANSL